LLRGYGENMKNEKDTVSLRIYKAPGASKAPGA
jgi:hypothetical protein